MNSEREKIKKELLEEVKNLAEKYQKKHVHLFLIDDEGFDYIYHKDEENKLGDDSQKFADEIEKMFIKFACLPSI